MKRFLLLLSVMMLMPLCALAVTTVPGTVTEVADEAFANTAIDALIIPATVKSVGADVLAGSDASYIYLNGANTTLANEGGVPFVFGPASSPAASLDNFYDESKLVSDSGLYYYVTDVALPLCAQAPSVISGSVTIPKLLNGVPVTSAEQLYLSNTGLTEVHMPAYLGQVDGVKTVNFQTMSVAAPTADVTESPAGHYVTWTTSVEGAYGDVVYEWSFEVGGETVSTTTFEPTIKYAPMEEGVCTVTVTARDAAGDHASATGGQVTMTEMKTLYRALLVGNSYPGEINSLDGPMSDVAAMLTVLNTMSGTPYKATTARNITATGIQAAIATAFAGAQPSDVSLFYFSGHGTEKGDLVGTGNTYLTVYALRSALQKIPGTKIVLLDSCYSGSAINRSTSSPSAFNRAIISALSSASRSAMDLEDAGYIVLTSCSQDQKSVSLSGGNNHYWGVFTYGLCYGSGYDEWERVSLGRLPADANGDGAITLAEAYQGVQERVGYLSTMTPIDQATQYYGDPSFVLWAK